MKSGIYQILNLLNDKRYIGSSCRLTQRFASHKSALRNSKHLNSHLQRAYNIFGGNNFKIEILEYCKPELLIEREQHWIYIFDFKMLYNARRVADRNNGVKHTEEYKLKKRQFRHTPEAKEKIGEASKRRSVRPPLSKEHIEKIKGINKGRPGWNKGLKGILKANKTSFKKGEHRSIYTEFKKGQKAWNKGIPNLNHASGWLKGKKGYINAGSWNPKKFEIVSPEMVLYKGIGIVAFATTKGLSCNILNIIKKNGQYRGWRLPKESDTYFNVEEFDSTKITT